MKMREMMSIIQDLPEDVKLGQIHYVIDETCPQIIDSPQYKMWRKAVIKQEMYQNALIDALEDAVNPAEEDDNPLAWLDKYKRTTVTGDLT